MTRRGRFFSEWFGVFLFCAALCAFFQFATPYLSEEDAYFHIKVAWLLRHHGLFLTGFPWSYFSLWRDGFSDGSLLFHLYLIPFTFGDLIFGAKAATVLLSAFMFSSFFAILTLNGVRARLYWMWLLLLGGGFFWWRMLDTRPQILSVIFLLWSVHFLINGRLKPFAALSFFYPFAYVAAFLPQVFAAARWGYLRVADRRDERAPFFAGILAFALAMFLHPYFPKNLRFFWVQNFYVMYLEMTRAVDLSLAVEFLPLDTRQFVGGHAVLLAHLFALALVFMRRRTPLSERTRVTFVIASIAVLLASGSKRFVEYAVPLTTLFCAFLADDLPPGLGVSGRHARAAAVVLFAVMGAASGLQAKIVRGDFLRVGPPRFQRLARTLSDKALPGELIFTCDWDEPPELLFYNAQHRYPVMMDPTFMYAWNPEIWRRWHDVANARLTPDETMRTLAETFGARHGLCGSNFRALRALVGADRRYRILDEDQNGYVFEILRSPR